MVGLLERIKLSKHYWRKT